MSTNAETSPATTTDYAVAPGEYLAEWQERVGTSQHAVSVTIGVDPGIISDIFAGVTPIDDELATKLEQLTAIQASTWLRFEEQYQQDLARLRDTP